MPLAIALIAWWQWHRWGVSPGIAAGAVRHLQVRNQWVHELLGVLAPLALGLGFVATATFGAALLALRGATAQALQSRDALLQAFEKGRRWLPLFMLLQTGLVFGGLICLLSFESIQALTQPIYSDGRVKMGIFFALVAMALAWYGVMILRDTLRLSWRNPDSEPIHLMGQALEPAEAPRLWDFVRDIAQRTRARLPDSVIVGLNEGFFVTEHPVALANGQRVPQGRVLYLPLPYMAFLDRQQVTAVIAHELGHFTGEDTLYSLRFTPVYRGFVNSIHAVTNEGDENDDGWRAWISAPISLYGKWFLASFDEALHHWGRERELAADAFGRGIAGTGPSALALLRLGGLHEIVDEALAHNHLAAAGQREGVLKMVRRLVRERGLADPQERLQDCQTHPFDTHPPLKLRLDALGVVLTPELVSQARDPRDTGLLAELGLEASTPG